MRVAIASSAIALTLVFAASMACSAPPAYTVDVSQVEAAWRAEVKFTDASHPAVTLIYDDEAGPPWKPLFETSPDGRWILYVQKKGSGDNIAWLYTVDDAGRVLRCESRLDWMAWQFSDTISDHKMSELYHTGIDDWTWTDRETLRFTLRGSHAKKSGTGVRLHLEYDLKTNKITRDATKG